MSLKVDTLYLEITTACNLKCIHCNRKRLQKKDEFMSLEKIKELINKNPTIKLVNIIGLGEPLLHPEFIELCKYIKEKNLLFCITTNGTIMTDRIIENYPSNSSLFVSLDSVREDKLKYIRGISPDIVVKNIIKFKQKRPHDVKLVLQPVITKGFLKEVDQYIQLAKMLGAYIQPILPAVSSKEMFDELYPSDELNSILDHFSKHSFFSPNVTKEPEFRVCQEPFYLVLVTIDGTIYPCCFMNSMRYEGEVCKEFYKDKLIEIETDKYILGNIFSGTFDISRLNKIREAIRETSQMDFENRNSMDLVNPYNYCKICLSRWKRGC